MTKSKDILKNFASEKPTVKVVALYLGAKTTQSKDGYYAHQLALLPSDRDLKGGVVNLKSSKELNLEENGVYFIEANSSSERPDNHFGISIYWLNSPVKVSLVSRFQEVE